MTWLVNYVRKTAWRRDGGLALYKAKFTKENRDGSWESCWLRFWVRKPGVAVQIRRGGI